MLLSLWIGLTEHYVLSLSWHNPGVRYFDQCKWKALITLIGLLIMQFGLSGSIFSMSVSLSVSYPFLISVKDPNASDRKSLLNQHTKKQTCYWSQAYLVLLTRTCWWHQEAWRHQWPVFCFLVAIYRFTKGNAVWSNQTECEVCGKKPAKQDCKIKIEKFEG